MKTIQDYIDRYSKVASNLGYTGQSIEVLVQLLANASYIGEMENATYMNEASLEKCNLLNSKIQHCVDRMYSVFRGSCPRVIMKIKPTKYLNLKPYDTIIESQNFTVQYLAYYQIKDSNGNIVRGKNQGQSTTTTGGTSAGVKSGNFALDGINDNARAIDTTDTITLSSTKFNASITTSLTAAPSSHTIGGTVTGEDETSGKEIDQLYTEDFIKEGYTGDWNYGTATFYPNLTDKDSVDDVQIILGFIAPKRTDTLTVDKTITINNTYYVDCLADNLSNDMYVEINNERVERTRIFAEHILSHKIFDLTLPGFGSRLYLANYYKDTVGRDSQEVQGMTENAHVFARYYGYQALSSYTDSEKERLQFKGAKLVAYKSDYFLKNVCGTDSEYATGLCYIPEISRDDTGTIHYKANRDRFVSSILRSNSDIGTVLEEAYPEIIESGGTNYIFTTNSGDNKNSNLKIYYIPKNDAVLLSSSQIEDFVTNKRAYYVITSIISINPGTKYIATFNIDLDLYKNTSDSYETSIGENILINNYQHKFNLNLGSCIKDIESLISKISNVKRVNSISITYTNADGKGLNSSEVENIDTSTTYYDIKYSITTKVVESK